jgi:hypothetical protein
VKRHKLFAQCSGVRDPAAFVKRSKLATPGALNRDYNFLTGVERVLARDVHAEVEEVNGEEEEDEGGRAAEQRREAFLNRSGVVVKRAPRGMKRARENRTDVSR